MTREEAIRRMECCRNFLANNYSDMGEPNFTAFNMAIEALKQQPCEDTIDRKEVLDWLKNKRTYNRQEAEDIDNFYHFINNLPSITPIRPKGHWNMGMYAGRICSACDYRILHCDISPNFCPNCGAKMIYPQESEDKE